MKKVIVIVFLFFALRVIVACPVPHPSVMEQRSLMVKKEIWLKSIYGRTLTIELLNEALYYAEVKEAEIAYKQAIIETGWFSSDIYLNANNLFGMRLPKQRQTTAIGEYNSHAAYKHWFDSVLDYKLLQDYYLERGYSLNEYFVFLEDIGYATDSLYILKIKALPDET